MKRNTIVANKELCLTSNVSNYSRGCLKILVWEWNGFRSSIIKHFNACTRVRPSFKIVKSECFERQLKMGPFPEFIVDWKIPLEIPFFFFFSFSRLQRKRIWRDLNFKGLNWKRQFNNVKPNQPFEAKTVSKKGR